MSQGSAQVCLCVCVYIYIYMMPTKDKNGDGTWNVGLPAIQPPDMDAGPRKFY
jgi:hypothetical protein